MTTEKPRIHPQLSGWWIVNHPKPSHRHAVADLCPINDPRCQIDRETVLQANAKRMSE